jgi:hypothetical protein
MLSLKQPLALVAIAEGLKVLRQESSPSQVYQIHLINQF